MEDTDGERQRGRKAKRRGNLHDYAKPLSLPLPPSLAVYNISNDQNLMRKSAGMRIERSLCFFFYNLKTSISS